MEPVSTPTASRPPAPSTLRSYWVSSAALANHCVRSAVGRRQRYIMVLSHMRSGSSLLHHLLQTHPSVLGAGESNRVYREAGDLRRLSLWVHVERGAMLRFHPFVTDQINHNEKLRNHSLLLREDVCTLILIRKPLASVASILRLSADFYGSNWDAARAIEYYLARIDALVEAAATLRRSGVRPPLLVTYENLVVDTRRSLDAIQSHLRLDRPLSPDYSTFPFTGRRGDPSERIRSGRILPETRGESADEQVLSADQQRMLSTRYDQAMTALRVNCGDSHAS
jgi:hypothetical protein